MAQRLLGFLDGDVGAANEGLGVVLAHRALRINELVHQRLGERGVIGLVVSAPAVGDEIDDDVLVEGLAELEGQACHSDDRFGIVAVDVEDRGLHHACDVGGVDARAAVARGGGEADLVVDDDVDGAAGAVALQLGEVERLGHHPLAGKRGISVQEQRKDVERAIARELILLRAHDALENRVDGLEMRRVSGDVHERLVPVEAAVGPARAQVVLHITGALHGFIAVVALELGEDLRVGLAGDVGEDVEAATVRHADGDLDDVITRGGGQDLVEQRDERLRPFQGEPLLADVFGLQEGLERLGLVELVQDSQLLLAARLVVGDLHALLDPVPLLGVLDVHVLDADAAGVGVTQDPEDLAQLHERPTGETAGGELPVEVPQGEAVGEHIEVGVHALLVFERVGVGHEVTAHAIGVNDLLHAHRLVEISFMRGRDVAGPPDGLVGDAQAAEDVAVEVILAQQQLVDATQELPGLRALDDAVVVRRGQGERLGHGIADERFLRGSLPLGRVLHGADADDAALPLHESRDGMLGAESARIGEADGRSCEIVDRESAAARAAYDVLVSSPEAREVEGLSTLDVGHEQLAGAVVLDQVDRHAEVDLRTSRHSRLAVGLGEGVVHGGHGGHGADERVSDEVREGDLATAAAREVVVDDDAVVHEQLGGHTAHAGRRGHRERRLHVAYDAGGGPAQRHDLAARGSRGRGRRSNGRGRNGCGGSLRGREGYVRCGRGRLDLVPVGCGVVELSLECGAVCRCVVGEEVPPGRIDALAVGEVLLIDLVDEPLIGSEPALRHSSRVVAATPPSLRRACPTGAALPARRAGGDLPPRSGPGRARSRARGPRGHPWPLRVTPGD